VIESKELDKVLEMARKKRIPETFPEFAKKRLLDDYNFRMLNAYRNELIKSMGYLQISYEWVKPLADFIGTKKCLEIMSGNGALSSALRKCGVDIVATDDYSWGIFANKNNHWLDIENISARKAIKKYDDVKYIICSWPPYDTKDAYEALKMMRTCNASARMIYFGEPLGGCTGDEKFHNAKIRINDINFDEVIMKYHRWSFIVYDEPELIR